MHYIVATCSFNLKQHFIFGRVAWMAIQHLFNQITSTRNCNTTLSRSFSFSVITSFPVRRRRHYFTSPPHLIQVQRVEIRIHPRFGCPKCWCANRERERAQAPHFAAAVSARHISFCLGFNSVVVSQREVIMASTAALDCTPIVSGL